MYGDGVTIPHRVMIKAAKGMGEGEGKHCRSKGTSGRWATVWGIHKKKPDNKGVPEIKGFGQGNRKLDLHFRKIT